jgi:hypothetical protein
MISPGGSVFLVFVFALSVITLTIVATTETIALTYGFHDAQKHLIKDSGECTEHFQNGFGQKQIFWDMEMPISTDISSVKSKHPIHRAYFYGDEPARLQCMLNKAFNDRGLLSSKAVINLTTVKWTEFSSITPKLIDEKVVEDALEDFLHTSGLRNRNYYIVASILKTYDYDVSMSLILMHIITCIYIPSTTHAKTIEFDCLCLNKSKFYFDNVKVRGVIHESFIPHKFERWTASF